MKISNKAFFQMTFQKAFLSLNIPSDPQPKNQVNKLVNYQGDDKKCQWSRKVLVIVAVCIQSRISTNTR